MSNLDISQHAIVERLHLQGREIVLVGTAHISQVSVELVHEILSQENPDLIGVELDRERLYQLKNPHAWKEMDLMQVIKEGKTYLLLLNLMLANMQKRLGEKVGVQPGSEMLSAVQFAETHTMPIALLDRDVKITLKRAFHEMSLIEKIRLLFGVTISIFTPATEVFTAETVESLKDRDLINKLLQQLGKEMPSIKRVLVDERDLYIAHKILSAPGQKMVAVLGAGHLDGVKKYLLAPEDVSLLETIPVKHSYWGTVLKFAIPALFLAILVWALWFKGIGVAANLVLYWILVTGIGSALGALLARAHWKSIITAFAVAPLTTLHPALAAGWFAGYMETKQRAPQVKDFEGLRDLNSLEDFGKNRVTHILIVTALTNIGASMGTLVAFPILLGFLG